MTPDPKSPQRRPEPRLQRPEPRREQESAIPIRPEQSLPRVPSQPPSSDAQPGSSKIGHIVAALLLLIASFVLIGGSDEKRSSPPSPVAANAETVPTEVVVDLRDNATDAEIAVLGQSAGIQLRYCSPHSVSYKLMVADVEPGDRDRVLAVLRASKVVEFAEPQFVYHLDQAGAATPAPASGRTFVPNDPLYPRQWHLKQIGMEEAWAKTKGKGATVAIIDSGLGEMTGNGVVQGQDFSQTQIAKGYNFTDNTDVTADDNIHGHGTHVAGTIAESTDNGILGAGVAPEAKLMPLRVADARGNLNMSSVAQALHFAADHDANVANMSLGGGANSQILEKALQYAIKKNVTLVCAAGNTGREGVEYPGKFNECITVSAVGPGYLTSSYSTWGTEVDIAGPGGEPKQGLAAMVWQNTFMQRNGFFGPSGPRVDDFFPLVGTSMATPHVSGVAALLVSLGMTDPKEIRSQLRKTAKKYAPADHYGAGVLDAARAVETVTQSKKYDKLQIAIAVGVAALLLTIGRSLQRKTDPMFFVHKIALGLALGLFLPIGVEKLAGFGSYWNLLGHSVVVAIVFLLTPRMERSGFWQVFAFTLGIVLHLLLDADSGHSPFLVYPQQRILFWMYTNAAVGVYFAASAFFGLRRREMVARSI